MCFRRIKINGNLHTRVEAEKIFEVMTKRIKELEGKVAAAENGRGQVQSALNKEKQRNLILSDEIASFRSKLPLRGANGRFISKNK